MTAAPQLLQRLRQLGVRFNLAGDAVQVDAPTSALTNSDVVSLKKSRDQIRVLLKVEAANQHGKRLIPNRVSCLDVKRWLGWDSFEFSRFCHRTIGRPGPANRNDDEHILAALLEFVTAGGNR